MNEKEKYLPRERILSTVSSRYHRAMKITFHLSPTSVLYRHLRGRNEIKCRDARESSARLNRVHYFRQTKSRSFAFKNETHVVQPGIKQNRLICWDNVLLESNIAVS